MCTNKNSLSRSFRDLRNLMRCVYCYDDGQFVIADDDFWEITEQVTSIPSIDECKLYRYSGADDRNICNLCKQKLHLSPTGALNDMFEGIAPAQHQQMTDKDWDEIGKLVFIKCFSENWNNLLMWAHYADGGRGMCVEYDLAQLKRNEPILRYLYPVHYSSERYIKDGLTDLHSEIQDYQRCSKSGNPFASSSWLNNLMAFYLTKSSEWEYEQEWRIVVPQYELEKQENQSIFESENFILPCVSAVYLGCKMPSETKEQIRRVVDMLRIKTGREIAIHELVMKNSDYTLSIK